MRYSMLSSVMVGLLLVAVALPAVAQEGESARGTVKIEAEDLGEPDSPNEVKVGCDFRLDFFGFEEQSVPVRLSLQPPSGEASLQERTAVLQAAQGNELSGSLSVDLTDELSQVAPADAEDFDYKVRVDVVVKETDGTEVSKSSMLFIDCGSAVLAYRASAAQGNDNQPAQPTRVAAGSGGLASAAPPAWIAVSMALGLLLLAAPVLVTARRRAGRD